MTRRHVLMAGGPVLLAGGLLAAAGCSDEDRADLLDDATETVLRNFTAQQGAEQFNAAGYEIDDDGFTCRADVGEGGLESIEVVCEGTTVDGGDAVLSGTTAELPGASITELKGDFTATVDGDVVFETDQLGG